MAQEALARGEPRALTNKGHPDRMLVEVLLALQAMAADRHAVVGRVDDQGVVELADLLEPAEDAADLLVDVLVAGELPAELVA